MRLLIYAWFRFPGALELRNSSVLVQIPCGGCTGLPVSRFLSNVANTVRTALRVDYITLVRNQTLPTEAVAGTITRHVVAAPAFLDVDAALLALLCAKSLYFLDRVFVILLFRFAATSRCVPGTVAGETEFVIAVWTRDRLLGVALGYALAGFDRKIIAVLGGENRR
jgi:hypothetical protein